MYEYKIFEFNDLKPGDLFCFSQFNKNGDPVPADVFLSLDALDSKAHLIAAFAFSINASREFERIYDTKPISPSNPLMFIGFHYNKKEFDKFYMIEAIKENKKIEIKIRQESYSIWYPKLIQASL